MPFSAKAVANEFLDLAKGEGRSLTPIKLIKLVYLAHGWRLGLFSQPLLNERVKAWRYGPVIPSLYHEFKRFGNTNITSLAQEWRNKLGKPIRILATIVSYKDDDPSSAGTIIESVWNAYKKLGPLTLSDLTHEDGSPWSITWNERDGKEFHGTDISNKLIAEYFEKLAKSFGAH